MYLSVKQPIFSDCEQILELLIFVRDLELVEIVRRHLRGIRLRSGCLQTSVTLNRAQKEIKKIAEKRKVLKWRQKRTILRVKISFFVIRTVTLKIMN